MFPIYSAHRALFFDFDGTLVNFADKPEAVFVSVELRALLAQLYELHDGALALISGRSISSIDALLQMPQLPIAGGHGAEWRLPGGEIRSISLGAKDFTSVVECLTGFAIVNGLIYENKSHSFALHFRQQPHLQQEVDQFIEQSVACMDDLRIIYGNCVREIQPKGIDKGIAVARFMELAPFTGRTACYFGDDTTDEDAFQWVNAHRGLSYKVGPGPSCALHRIEDVAAVHTFLRNINNL